ncbi:MAG: sigma-70 family RNA polymerase sigma factor [Acidobacteriota bacterium]
MRDQLCVPSLPQHYTESPTTLKAVVEYGLEQDELLALDQALERLAAVDQREAHVVELRFFAGLTVPEIADLLGVSRRTVEADWAHARAWLLRELAKGWTG